MVIQRRAVLHRAGDGVALVTAELDDFVRHLAGERHPLTVIHARDVVVVGVVVGPHQHLGAVAIGKQPVLELVADRLRLLVGLVGALLIDVRLAFSVAERHAHRAIVQQRLQDGASVHLRGAVGGRVRHRVARRDRGDEAAALLDVADIGLSFVAEQVPGEVLIDRLRHPWRANPRNNLAGRHVLGLHFLQRSDVRALAGGDGLRQLGPHVARQVGVAQHVFVGGRVAEDRRLVAAGQLVQNVLRIAPKQLPDVGRIQPAALGHGHRQSVDWAVHLAHSFARRHNAPGKDRRLLG